MSRHTSKNPPEYKKSIQSAVVVVQTKQKQKVVAFNYPTYESKTSPYYLYSPF